MFLEISQNSHISPHSVQMREKVNFIQKESLAQVFSCEFCAKFLRAPFFRSTTGRLLLKLYKGSIDLKWVKDKLRTFHPQNKRYVNNNQE